MLIILTNSQDATSTFLTPILTKAGIPYLRLDTDDLISRIAFSYRPEQPRIRIDGHWYEPADVSHVWYRRPEQLKGVQFDSSPESKYARTEWTEFIECFFSHVPKRKWMNHPSCNSAASRKLEQLTTATRLGFSIPDTLATQDSDELRRFYEKHNGKVIVKPLATGYIEREGGESDSLIYTNRVLEHHLANLDDLPHCPTLFQQLIEKECDVRITVVDSDLHAVELRAADETGRQRCDIRRNNMTDVAYRRASLPDDVAGALRELVAQYGLRFAAIDMVRSVKGDWFFLEINPNGQWAWLDISAGLDIASSFVKSFSAGNPENKCAS
jgi:hypothetical protein